MTISGTPRELHLCPKGLSSEPDSVIIASLAISVTHNSLNAPVPRGCRTPDLLRVPYPAPAIAYVVHRPVA